MSAMSKLKVKEKQRALPKRAKRAAPKKQPKKLKSGVWEKQVEELTQREFKNADAAIQAVCAGVLDKLGAQGQERAAQEQFMLDLLNTDPELKGCLLASLRVRKR